MKDETKKKKIGNKNGMIRKKKETRKEEKRKGMWEGRKEEEKVHTEGMMKDCKIK